MKMYIGCVNISNTLFDQVSNPPGSRVSKRGQTLSTANYRLNWLSGRFGENVHTQNVLFSISTINIFTGFMEHICQTMGIINYLQ